MSVKARDVVVKRDVISMSVYLVFHIHNVYELPHVNHVILKYMAHHKVNPNAGIIWIK